MILTIQTNEGPVNVRAKQFGALAVHRDPEFKVSDPDVWTLTHIQTGHLIAKGLDREKALALIHGTENEDWNFSDPKAIPLKTRNAIAVAMNALTKRAGA